MINKRMIEITEGTCDLCGSELDPGELFRADDFKVRLSLTIYDRETEHPRKFNVPRDLQSLYKDMRKVEQYECDGVVCTSCATLINRIRGYSNLKRHIMEQVDLSTTEED